MSIHEKAVLVTLSLSSLGKTRKDKTITNEILLSKSAKDGAGRWLNLIWPTAALQPIQQLDGKIRKYLQEKTLPWIDDGRRLLPSNYLQSVADQIRQYRHEREALISSHFFGNYHGWIEEMRIARGALYNRDDYPTIEQARKRFSMEWAIEPIPHGNDFRVSLDKFSRAEIEENVRTALGQAEETARRELVSRILTPLKHMADVLSRSNSKVFDSLLSNILDIAHAIPDFNVTSDPRLDEIHKLITTRIADFDTESIRENPVTKRRAARIATEVSDAISAFMGTDADEDEEEDSTAA